MKKLLALLSVVSLAFAAQATYTYTYQFQLTIDGIVDNGGPIPTKLVLIDTSASGNNQIVGYINKDDVDFKVDESGKYWTASLKDGAQKQHQEDVEHNIRQHTLTAGSITKQASVLGPNASMQTFEISFTSEIELTGVRTGQSGGWESGDANLKAILTNDEGSYYREIDGSKIGYTKTPVGMNFNSYIALPVPEPTSGVMLLLGMAGLALRRRKVA